MMAAPLPLVRLIREPSTTAGTFGRLETDGFSCLTGELPWKGNATGVSCIPTGRYLVIWAMSPRFKRNTYRLPSVPGRAGVLIHPANLMGDADHGLKAELNGCIALGYSLGVIDGQPALLQSRAAVAAFEEHMGHQPFELEVSNA